MGKKQILILLLLLAPFVVTPVYASQLRFEPSNQLYTNGSVLSVDLMADIEAFEAVFGFGFDLSFDGGTTYIPGPGAMGSYLTYTGFAVNAVLFDDPFLPVLWDDGDGIAGAVDFGSPEVWGTDLLLGTFSFSAPAAGMLGVETIFIGPFAGGGGSILVDDFSVLSVLVDEGLIGLQGAVMPNNPTASFTPRQIETIPEPASMLLFGTGIIGLCGYIRKKKK